MKELNSNEITEQNAAKSNTLVFCDEVEREEITGFLP